MTQGGRYLTGITRQRLDEWFAAHPITDEDRAPEMVADTDADNTVYWRVERVDEALAYFCAKWVIEEWPESIGEVGE